VLRAIRGEDQQLSQRIDFFLRVEQCFAQSETQSRSARFASDNRVATDSSQVIVE
jgi:hypothetical protein